MNNVKAVIFDLDDTLYFEIDYVISGFKCVSEYLSVRVGISSNELFKCLLALFKENRLNVFDRLFKMYNFDKADLIQQCLDVYRNHWPNIKLLPEAEAILIWLKNNNYKTGIITDGRPVGQWNKIKVLDIQKYCDAIIITDELGGLGFRKPNELSYRIMLKKLNVRPKEAVYIGDNPLKDFIAANKLGMFTIMLKNDKGLYQNDKVSKEYLAQVIITNLINIKDYLVIGKINVNN